MVSGIIKELKAISERLDREITSAHLGMRLGDEEKAERARILIQEAITALLPMN